MTCKCLTYGKNYLDSSFINGGLGSIVIKEEGVKVRECTHSTTLPCYRAFCTNCKEHNLIRAVTK